MLFSKCQKQFVKCPFSSHMLRPVVYLSLRLSLHKQDRPMSRFSWTPKDKSDCKQREEICLQPSINYTVFAGFHWPSCHMICNKVIAPPKYGFAQQLIWAAILFCMSCNARKNMLSVRLDKLPHITVLKSSKHLPLQDLMVFGAQHMTKGALWVYFSVALSLSSSYPIGGLGKLFHVVV